MVETLIRMVTRECEIMETSVGHDSVYDPVEWRLIEGIVLQACMLNQRHHA